MMRARRGLSLVEVLIAVVLLGIVGAGITRLLQSQMQFFSRSTNARDARAVSRNALNLMRGEMRMIEPRGIVAAAADSFVVRVPYATGVHCSSSTVTFAPVDSMSWASALFGGYVYRDTTISAVNTFVPSTSAPTAGATTACTSVGITPVDTARLLTLSPALPITTAGAPVLLYQTVTYRFRASTLMPGRTALWRQVLGGTAEEIAAPFDDAARFRFYLAGQLDPQDAVPGTLSNIAGVQLVLQGESQRISSGTGTPESTEARISILFRNAVQ